MTAGTGNAPRVLLVGPGRGEAGGVAAVIDTLLESSMADRFEFVVVSTYRDGSGPTKAVRALIGIGRTGWLLLRSQVDIVYLHTSSGFSFRRKAVVAAMARALRRPYVVHVHASGFDRYCRTASRWEQSLVRRTLSGAAAVIALSPEWERRILDFGSCRTTSIPNPVVIPSAFATLDSTKPAHIVCLGRLGERKGSRTLVRALALLDGRHADARLTLAGDGDQLPVRREAERLGVAGRLDLPGWINAEERGRLLLSAHVFALPAREEGLPVALLEAMAYGLPVVASPVGGIPDVLEAGRNGYLVPPDDPRALACKIRLVLDDPDLARQMGGQARADAQAHFAIDIVAGRIADVLSDALHPTGGRPAGTSKTTV